MDRIDAMKVFVAALDDVMKIETSIRDGVSFIAMAEKM